MQEFTAESNLEDILNTLIYLPTETKIYLYDAFDNPTECFIYNTNTSCRLYTHSKTALCFQHNTYKDLPLNSWIINDFKDVRDLFYTDFGFIVKRITIGKAFTQDSRMKKIRGL